MTRRPRSPGPPGAARETPSGLPQASNRCLGEPKVSHDSLLPRDQSPLRPTLSRRIELDKCAAARRSGNRRNRFRELDAHLLRTHRGSRGSPRRLWQRPRYSGELLPDPHPLHGTQTFSARPCVALADSGERRQYELKTRVLDESVECFGNLRSAHGTVQLPLQCHTKRRVSPSETSNCDRQVRAHARRGA